MLQQTQSDQKSVKRSKQNSETEKESGSYVINQSEISYKEASMLYNSASDFS